MHTHTVCAQYCSHSNYFDIAKVRSVSLLGKSLKIQYRLAENTRALVCTSVARQKESFLRTIFDFGNFINNFSFPESHKSYGSTYHRRWKNKNIRRLEWIIIYLTLRTRRANFPHPPRLWDAFDRPRKREVLHGAWPNGRRHWEIRLQRCECLTSWLS